MICRGYRSEVLVVKYHETVKVTTTKLSKFTYISLFHIGAVSSIVLICTRSWKLQHPKMSLSFVKSAVLSSTDGVSHNEETTLNSTETQSLRASGGGGVHKPLFEQLRANKDAEQEKDDEFQRSLRGMRPLDEEDCAHLDAVDRSRVEREHNVKSGIEHEVALFRAAREDRGLAQTVTDGDANTKISEPSSIATAASTKKEVIKKKIVPKFTIKKKRKRQDGSDSTKKNAADKKETNEVKDDVCETETKGKTEGDKKEIKNTTTNNDSDSSGGLLGLG